MTDREAAAASEPLPCPHCGGEAICDPWPAGNQTYYKVLCRSVITCGAAGSPRPTPEEAIAMWNRRAGQHVRATEAVLSWRCFHCDYVARTREEGVAHFGLAMNARQPSCATAGPLTEADIDWGMDCNIEDPSDEEAHAFERGVRFAEWKHGIRTSTPATPASGVIEGEGKK